VRNAYAAVQMHPCGLRLCLIVDVVCCAAENQTEWSIQSLHEVQPTDALSTGLFLDGCGGGWRLHWPGDGGESGTPRHQDNAGGDAAPGRIMC
jgi:hypothetical protein